MKKPKSLASLGIAAAMLLLVLTSCKNAPAPNGIEPPLAVVSEPFRVTAGDIVEVAIVDDPVAEGITQDTVGILDSPADIAQFVTLIDSSPPLNSDATADFYRIAVLTKKDGTELSLEFGGQGLFFKDMASNVFYTLHPKSKQDELRRLVERAEGKGHESGFGASLPADVEGTHYGYVAWIDHGTDASLLLLRDPGELDWATASEEDVLRQANYDPAAAWYRLDAGLLSTLERGQVVAITADNEQLDSKPPIRYGLSLTLLDH
ncbi:hypothetical protein [Paenibacillus methanolicus]|uniref:Uncharacterized protein n=1 Tax=Paenibacillus methanolicus TaxID=582686 RepID=A0A5S5C886_9BACL|nr:hypothetical protein [Paenibacillus methanolicus]TYP75517.1 hypothetical protein BCM02_104195 [Paenibacillus methanolicus]